MVDANEYLQAVRERRRAHPKAVNTERSVTVLVNYTFVYSGEEYEEEFEDLRCSE